MGGWKNLGDIPKVGKTYELDFETKLLNLDNQQTHVFLAVRMRGSSATQWGARIPAVYSYNDKAKWKVCTNCHSLYTLYFRGLFVVVLSMESDLNI